MKRLLLVSVGIALVAPASSADDLTPPSWRGAPGSTFQHWNFSGGPTGGPPDAGLANPYGVPFLAPGPTATWFPFGPPLPAPPPPVRPGVWGLAGVAGAGPGLVFTIPNAGVPPPDFKLMRIQVTFLDVIPLGAVGVPGFGTIVLGAPTFVTPLPDSWTHAYWDLTLPLCPPFETVGIGAPAGATCFIDQVVIDTICVPSPGSGAILALAGIVGVRRRRS